jgi:uncharacterized membrane protein YqjE
MGTMSYIFFGLMLFPLLAFLVWAIKQDKRKNYIGLALLVVGIIIATYTILSLDKNFMENNTQTAPKASSFK